MWGIFSDNYELPSQKYCVCAHVCSGWFPIDSVCSFNIDLQMPLSSMTAFSCCCTRTFSSPFAYDRRIALLQKSRKGNSCFNCWDLIAVVIDSFPIGKVCSFLLQNTNNFLKQLIEEKNKQNYVVIEKCSPEVK